MSEAQPHNLPYSGHKESESNGVGNEPWSEEQPACKEQNSAVGQISSWELPGGRLPTNRRHCRHPLSPQQTGTDDCGEENRAKRGGQPDPALDPHQDVQLCNRDDDESQDQHISTEYKHV